LKQGRNALLVRFVDADAVVTADRVPTLTRVNPAEDGNAVLDWNAEALDVARKERLFPPPATRTLAMVHLAIEQAIREVPPDQAPAATAAAAHQVLARLHRRQKSALDLRLALSLEESPAGPARDAAVAAGVAVADRWIAARTGDGAAMPAKFTPSSEPGRWQPTRPVLRPALVPQWCDVKPFSMTSPTQFRLPPPPAIGSPEYVQDVLEVLSKGEYFSTTRTVEESEIARYWAGQSGSCTPPGQWNMIATHVALERGESLPDCAKGLALLNSALADAAIACWEAKYHYDLWRPITASARADQDGSPETVPNPLWTSYITTPPFPEYPSGHSSFSGAAAVILSDWFGPRTSFRVMSDGLPQQFGVPDIEREFASFDEAAKEASHSRVLGGIHYTFSCREGLAMGDAVGRWVLERGIPVAETKP
jgi:hypothetical protein